MATRPVSVADLDYFSPKQMGFIGDGETDDTAAAQRMIDRIGDDEVTVWWSRGTYLLGDVTYPENAAHMVEKGAILKAKPGTTPTFLGPIEAGPHQIFVGEGEFILGGPMELLPYWWGAKGDQRWLTRITCTEDDDVITTDDPAKVFKPSDVGKLVALKIAASGDVTGNLLTTVAEYISPTSIRLSDPATADLGDPNWGFLYIGTDCTAAFNAAALCSSKGANNTNKLLHGSHMVTGDVTNPGGTMWVGCGSQGSNPAVGTSITHYSNGDLFIWDGSSERGNTYGTGGGLQYMLITKAQFGGPFQGGSAIKLVIPDPEDSSRRPGEMMFVDVLVYGEGSGASSGQWDYGVYADGSNATTLGARGIRTLTFIKTRTAGMSQSYTNFYFKDAEHVSMFHCQADGGPTGVGEAGITIEGTLYGYHKDDVDFEQPIDLELDEDGNPLTTQTLSGYIAPVPTGDVPIEDILFITAAPDNFHIYGCNITGKLLIKACNNICIGSKVSYLEAATKYVRGKADISSSGTAVDIIVNHAPSTFQIDSANRVSGTATHINDQGTYSDAPLRGRHLGNVLSLGWGGDFVNTWAQTLYRIGIGFLSNNAKAFFGLHAEHHETDANTLVNDPSGYPGFAAIHDHGSPPSVILQWNGVATPGDPWTSPINTMGFRSDGLSTAYHGIQVGEGTWVTAIQKVLRISPTVPMPALGIAAQGSYDYVIDIPGVSVGDAVVASIPNSFFPAGPISAVVWVNADNQVTVRINNAGSATALPATANWKLTVFKF